MSRQERTCCEVEALGTRMRGEVGRNQANGYSATGCVVLRGPWENQGEVKTKQENKCWTIIRTLYTQPVELNWSVVRKRRNIFFKF